MPSVADIEYGLSLLPEVGSREAARLSGASRALLERVAKQRGLVVNETATVARAAITRAAELTDRKVSLSLDLLDDIDELRARLFTPIVYKEARVVSDGATQGSHVEVVEIESDEPVPADQAKLVQAMTQLLDKLLVINGQVTSRVEVLAGQSAGDAQAELEHLQRTLEERKHRLQLVQSQEKAEETG